MDIKVITRHGPSNYGSVLQSIATLEILKRLGADAEIIDYQRADERGLKSVLATVNHKDGYSNSLKKLLYVVIRFPMEWMAQRKFDEIRADNLKMTVRCKNTSDLKDLHADLFMTGSDQVWGPVLTEPYDDNYFLGFVDDKKERYLPFAQRRKKRLFRLCVFGGCVHNDDGYVGLGQHLPRPLIA